MVGDKQGVSPSNRNDVLSGVKRCRQVGKIKIETLSRPNQDGDERTPAGHQLMLWLASGKDIGRSWKYFEGIKAGNY